jgi:hypothetical protein
MIHYKDIEHDMDSALSEDPLTFQKQIGMRYLRVLHCIAQDLDSISALYREHLEQRKQELSKTVRGSMDIYAIEQRVKALESLAVGKKAPSGRNTRTRKA